MDFDELGLLAILFYCDKSVLLVKFWQGKVKEKSFQREEFRSQILINQVYLLPQTVLPENPQKVLF